MGEPGFFKQLGLVLLIAALTACSSSSDNTPPPDQPQSTVPDVSGQSQSDAEQAISSATLLVGTITSEASDSVPAGSVIRTQPAAGISVAQNSSVNIILSSGPANVPVPTTAGGSQADAEAAIVAAGFVVGSVDTEASDSVPAGQVIRTVPAAGTEVARGASIDLVVSSGPANIMVPDVTNLTQMAAETAIGNAGLVTGLISTSPSDIVPVGNIISQNPVSGTMVSAGTTVNLTVSLGPANISVPNVVGLAQAQAEMDITGAGLVVGSVTLQADVNVAPGNVISQSPDAMTLAAAATPVDLVVSAGPDAVPVPDIVGLTETEANTVVVNAGLAIGNVTVEFSTTIDRGDVISQSLQPGALVLPDTPLDFVVSAGPPVNVPNVTGLARAAAESALTNLNLAVGTVTEVFDLNVPLGNVISQDPGAGTVVPEDTTVDLVISLGPPPVNVPNVVGLAEAQARATLTSNRLTIGNVSLVFSNTVAAGLVISQDPAAGVSVPDSSPVDLVVSNGPPPVPAPNVVGLTQAAATTALNNTGLVVGTVTTQFSSTVAAGDVISQNPASGTVVAVGSAVDLVVSDGPAPVNVPNVVGLSQALATTNITNAGLVVGTVSTQSSNTVPDGDVISQNPASGTSVAAGSSVDLVVSSGPASVTVPNVVGLSQAQASADLTALGLVVGTVSNQSSATVPSGDVISQNPASGASVANGSAVDLVVSSGPASAFSDEFNSNSIADWSLRHVVEGSAAQYTVLDINQSATGRLVIVPINTDGWFDGDDAPLVFKNITGNFAVQTRVLADSRTNPGNPPSDNFNSAGIMARNAAGASGPENYVMVNLGKQRGNSAPADQRLGAESKTTVNSNSTLTIYNGSNEGDLILCRIGNEIRTYRFLTSDAGWTFMDSFDRSDLPATLQVGLVVSAFGGDDLRAEFDYVRLLATPTVAADCTP